MHHAGSSAISIYSGQVMCLLHLLAACSPARSNVCPHSPLGEHLMTRHSGEADLFFARQLLPSALRAAAMRLVQHEDVLQTHLMHAVAQEL